MTWTFGRLVKLLLSPFGRSSQAAFYFLAPVFAIGGAYFTVLCWRHFNLVIDKHGEALPFWQGIGVLLPIYIVASWPLIALAFRRAHDSGLPGPVLAVPTLAFLPMACFTFAHLLPSGGSLSATRASTIKILMIAVPVTGLISLGLGLRNSQPGPNKYGPNPHEVPQ